MAERSYYTYILASRSRNLYIGVTNDLTRRLAEHRSGKSKFTNRYRIERLVHVEITRDIRAAIRREKQLKSMSRAKKMALISATNAAWDDLQPAAPS